MFLFDAHLDLSMNAILWNRDLTDTLIDLREREVGLNDLPGRTRATVSLPEMKTAEIGICIATQIGHSVSKKSTVPGWNSPEIAWAQTQGQLAWYRAMEERGLMRQISNLAQLDAHADSCRKRSSDLPLGYILSLEGADSLLDLSYLKRAYDYGLRALGPAHYGPGRYAPGTGSEGGLEPAGRELLKEMQQLGIILDVTHLTDEGFWEALDLYDGPLWASHSNCRSLVPDQRQLSDDQIKALVERDAVIGAVFDGWMLVPNWIRGETTPESSGLMIEAIADHIDHISQIAGSSKHSGIGSDLDGGFGNEQTPQDLRSIADLQSLMGIFERRGYQEADIEGIMHGNWLRAIRQAWA